MMLPINNKHVSDHLIGGSVIAKLGIQSMPCGYSLMFSHDFEYYWLRWFDGMESVRGCNKWDCYRGAKKDKLDRISSLDLDEEKLGIIWHCLGYPKMYRNYYCAGVGHHNYETLLEMVEEGHLKQSKDSFSLDSVFSVTLDLKELFSN